MDYEQMEIDITLESDRDLKENMQATAKFALGQIMEYQHPTKVKNRHEGYGIAAEGYASLQGKMNAPGGNDASKAIAEVTGLSAGSVAPMAAVVMCQGF